MPLHDSTIQPEPRAYVGARTGLSVQTRVARLHTDFATRVADSAWSALHVLGAHRWREGWETDLEKGWSRYRGSRCTICDEPWEGW